MKLFCELKPGEKFKFYNGVDVYTALSCESAVAEKMKSYGLFVDEHFMVRRSEPAASVLTSVMRQAWE